MTGRRDFLRGLVSLPLIGGAVSLIGNPVSADVQPSEALLRRYIAWLANEHAAALMEHERPGVRYVEPCVWPDHRVRMPMYWWPEAPDIERDMWLTLPSSRAAVILSTAGVGWR